MTDTHTHTYIHTPRARAPETERFLCIVELRALLLYRCSVSPPSKTFSPSTGNDTRVTRRKRSEAQELGMQAGVVFERYIRRFVRGNRRSRNDLKEKERKKRKKKEKKYFYSLLSKGKNIHGGVTDNNRPRKKAFHRVPRTNACAKFAKLHNNGKRAKERRSRVRCLFDLFRTDRSLSRSTTT